MTTQTPTATPMTDAACRAVDELCVGMGGFLELVTCSRGLEIERNKAITLYEDLGERFRRLEYDRADLIADLTAITDGLELHLTTPGAPLHGDTGTRNFVTRARATLARIRGSEDASRVQS